MRLFVGVELDAGVKDRAAQVIEDLPRRILDRGLRCDLRWVPAHNLHITLWFIGNVDDEGAGAIQLALNRPFETPPFDLRVHGCGTFPRSGPPRVAWIGAGDSGSMTRLYEQVRDRLVPLGFEEDRRSYSAHVTIARVRDPGRDPRALRQVVEAAPSDCGVSRVRAVTLFLSRLSPGGAAYEPLLRVPLA